MDTGVQLQVSVNKGISRELSCGGGRQCQGAPGIASHIVMSVTELHMIQSGWRTGRQGIRDIVKSMPVVGDLLRAKSPVHE